MQTKQCVGGHFYVTLTHQARSPTLSDPPVRHQLEQPLRLRARPALQTVWSQTSSSLPTLHPLYPGETTPRSRLALSVS